MGFTVWLGVYFKKNWERCCWDWTESFSARGLLLLIRPNSEWRGKEKYGPRAPVFQLIVDELSKLKSDWKTEERVAGRLGKIGCSGPYASAWAKNRELLGSTAAARAHNHGSWSLVWARLEEEERNLATQKCSEWAAGVHSWINLGLAKWLGRSMCGGEWQRATGIWGKNELHRGNRLTGMGHCDGVWWLACRWALFITEPGRFSTEARR
jgi:hypothetical protein